MERCWCEDADTQSLRGPQGTPVPEMHCTCLVQEAGTIEGPVPGGVSPRCREASLLLCCSSSPGGLELFSGSIIPARPP